MRVGFTIACQNGHKDLSDAQLVREEVRMAEIADEVGFDVIWAPEHHFDWYSMTTDNLQLLTWIAARTTRAYVGTAAIILPWNDPIRVVERISLLDALTGGRLVVGIGRGLARMEYDAFGIDMTEARDRFMESARMVRNALETGVIEGDGPYYPQKPTEIRPAPTRGLADRFYGVAMSPETAPLVAELGARMMFFTQFPIDQHMPGVETYREIYEQTHGAPAPPPHTLDFTVCHEDAGRAEELAREYVAGYYASVLHHYELMADYHAETKGYEAYATLVDFLKSVGADGAAQSYVDNQIWGTPDQMLEKLRARREVIGDFELNVCCSFAGMPFEDVERSVRLIGEHVVPEVRTWTADALEAPALA